jgi:hypothetical protein
MMGEKLYDAVSARYGMKTANFGAARRPKVFNGKTIPSSDTNADDVTHPVTACAMDDDCEVIFEEPEGDNGK